MRSNGAVSSCATIDMPRVPSSRTIRASSMCPRRPYFKMFEASSDTTSTSSSITSRSKPILAANVRIIVRAAKIEVSLATRHVTDSITVKISALEGENANDRTAIGARQIFLDG